MGLAAAGQPALDRLLRGDTLDQTPLPGVTLGDPHNGVHLVRSGKGTAIENDNATGFAIEEIGGGLQHERHYEVVLGGGVLNHLGSKERGARRILVEDDAAHVAGDGSSEGSFSGSGHPP